MAPGGAGGSVPDGRTPGCCLGTPSPKMSRAVCLKLLQRFWKALALQGEASIGELGEGVPTSSGWPKLGSGPGGIASSCPGAWALRDSAGAAPADSAERAAPSGAES